MKKISFLYILSFLVFIFVSNDVEAGCPNPNEPGGESAEGAQVYNYEHKTMQFCDGTTWWGMKGGSGALPSCVEGSSLVFKNGIWACSIPSTPATVTFVGSATDASNLATYTFSNQGIGAVASDRLVVVGLHWEDDTNASSLTSVSIGGVAASEIGQFRWSDTGAALFAALVPSGTTADIVLTFPAAQDRAGIGVWTLYGYSSSIAYDNRVSSGDDADLKVPPHGVVVAVGSDSSTGANTWSGATERYDVSVETSMQMTGGDFTNTTPDLLNPYSDYEIKANSSSPTVSASWQ